MDSSGRVSGVKEPGHSGSTLHRDIGSLLWSVAVPLSFLAALGVAVLTLAVAVGLVRVSTSSSAILAGVAAGVTFLLCLGAQWYLMWTRFEEPLAQLDAGQLFDTAQAGKRPDADTEKRRDCEQCIQEREAGDELAKEAAALLRVATSPEEFAAAACKLAARVWPLSDALCVERRPDDKALVALAGSRGGEALGGEELAAMMAEHPYAVPSLPLSIKTALLTGEAVAVGLPFSDDPRLPAARSFVALGLEHGGARNCVLYLASPQSEPPSPAPLQGLHDYLSLAYSRACYMAAVRDAAHRDALTGALTQSSFHTALEKEVVRSNRYGRAVACALVDLDDLRRVNLSYGSHVGDAVIAETARVIREQVRVSDQLARVSGGTFALLMPETSSEVALVVVERIRAQVQLHAYLVKRREVERMTLSAGIAAHPSPGATALSVYDAAHEAMLAAKRLGRNTVVVATPPLASRA